MGLDVVKAFVSAIILDGNSQIRFHKLMNDTDSVVKLLEDILRELKRANENALESETVINDLVYIGERLDSIKALLKKAVGTKRKRKRL